MKVIIAPTDFSENATNAVKYAAQLAKDLNGRLVLFHSYHELHGPYDLTSKPLTIDDESDTSLKPKADAILNDLRQDLITSYGITAETFSEHGSFVDNLVRLITNFNADLVVMGSKGGSAVEDVLFGSNALKVIRSVYCPVVLVPSVAKYVKPVNITYASEMNESELPALKLLLQYAAELSAKVNFVHVSKVKELTEPSKVMLKKMSEKMDTKDLTICYVQNADVADGVEEYLSKNPSDLLVIATEKRNTLQNLFHQSVAKKLSKRVSLPLMVFQRITPE